MDQHDNNLDPELQPELDPSHEHAAGWRAWNTLSQFLEDDGWHPIRITERPAYRMFYTGKNVDVRCIATVRIEAQQLVIYAYAPLKVPEEQRMRSVEYLTRANYGLNVGNFEFDFNDGEVRFKNGIDFEDEDLTYNWIRNTIYPAVRLMDFYFPGLMMVVFGGHEPAEAIKLLES